MNRDGLTDHDDEFVVVDLPVRLLPQELAMLNAAAAQAQKRSSVEIGGDTMDHERLARGRAARLVKLRHKRERVFGDKLFNDPAWNMLLELLIRRLDKQDTSLSTACIASGVPETTAVRFLQGLVENGLVVKNGNAIGQRVQHVMLTDEGFQKMIDVLTANEIAN